MYAYNLVVSNFNIMLQLVTLNILRSFGPSAGSHSFPFLPRGNHCHELSL